MREREEPVLLWCMKKEAASRDRSAALLCCLGCGRREVARNCAVDKGEAIMSSPM